MLDPRVLLVVALTALLGCSHMAGGVAPSNIPINGPYNELGPAKGTDCQYRLLGILPISGSNNTSQALQDAEASVAGANALIDIGVDSWTHNWILWTSHCTEVRATAVAVP